MILKESALGQQRRAVAQKSQNVKKKVQEKVGKSTTG